MISRTRLHALHPQSHTNNQENEEWAHRDPGGANPTEGSSRPSGVQGAQNGRVQAHI